MTTVEDVLAHFGVPGMKWGHRKGGGVDRVVSNKAKHPVHEDAMRVSVSKAKVKSSGTKALSTKELQELVSRMNLERQYSTISSGKGGKRAASAVKKMLISVGATQASKLANDIVSEQIAKSLKAKKKVS